MCPLFYLLSEVAEAHVQITVLTKPFFPPLLILGGDSSGYRRPLVTIGCDEFGKCSGGKCTLMSLSDLTGERARLASFSIIV